jgi:predicted ATPase
MGLGLLAGIFGYCSTKPLGMSKIEHDPLFLESINPQGILSFADGSPAIELRNLNVLIGANGSGKSNLIEVVELLRSTYTNIRNVLIKGGGVVEWCNKGQHAQDFAVGANFTLAAKHLSLHHFLKIQTESPGYTVKVEHLESQSVGMDEEVRKTIYDFANGRQNRVVEGNAGYHYPSVEGDLHPDQSVLAQRVDPNRYPEFAALQSFYRQVRIYRDWPLGKENILRRPHSADLIQDHLLEDFSNLAIHLNYLRGFPKTKRKLLDLLARFNEDIVDFDVRIVSNTVQLFLQEKDNMIPAVRLSDGTLRFLCLIAILCNPTPPALVCIEEPEIGMHPDILTVLSELLIEASERCQLIVTTHSDVLVDTFHALPESILVCEKHEGQTVIKRLNQDELQPWLEQYSLGKLWMDGTIGGNRW